MTNSKKTDLLYLIDGSGYIFRAFYALPPLTRKSDGMPVGAVSGFCNMIYKFLEDSKSKNDHEKPTHIAVIFDTARIHCATDFRKQGIKRKLGYSIFTHKEE